MEVLDRDFEVVRLLGRGKGGYSYLVTDGQQEYVLKQIHHEPCSYYTFGDKLQSELNDYAHLSKLGVPMPELLAVDRQRERLLKEYIPGPTVMDLVLADKMEQGYFDQMDQLCTRLYAAQTNIDYFPTNFIARDGQLWYVDYECNGYMEQWDFRHWGIRYWSKTLELEQWLRENKK